MLGIFYPESELFKPWQVVTHLFMHGSLTHLIFNMFALWMFGKNLELIWGSKRFFNFYFLSALGAMVLYFLVMFLQLQFGFEPEVLETLRTTPLDQIRVYGDTDPLNRAARLFYTPAVGASGAIFGLLGATYVLFPNSTVYLYFAIPIKMKYFVFGMAALSIYMGLANHGWDNVAHFAHLGGMLAGIFIVKYWNKTNRNSFY
jgi:membrane associated rhomboid family serine protease